MLDYDVRAAAIAAMLQANDIRFKFRGEGSDLKDGSGRLDWRFVEVIAIHPTTGKESVLSSFQQAAKFLTSVAQKR